MTTSRDIKIHCSGRKFIGSTIQHPIGGPYPNVGVTSVMPTSFHTMRTDVVTWTVHNNMKEVEGGKEAGVRESDGQRPQSG